MVNKTRAILVAGSAAVCCSLGWAQSTVEIYGVMDLGVAYANHVRTGAVGSPTGSVVRVDSGQAMASRLGFRGREDLGDGLKAVFVFEQGFSADTGVLGQGGRIFGRNAYVGLAGNFGEVQLGRVVTPIYDFGVALDPVGPARFAGPLFDPVYLSRADNSIKYVGKFGGFGIRAQYSLGYDATVANGGELPQFKVGKETGLYVDYTSNGLKIGVAFDRQNGTSAATQNDKNQRLAYAASYDFKVLKLYAAHERQTVQSGGVSNVNSLSWVGAIVPVTDSLRFHPGVYVYNPAGSSNRSVMPTVAAYYALSKRTELYTQAAYMKNQSAATTALIGSINPGSNQTGITVGIRHAF